MTAQTAPLQADFAAATARWQASQCPVRLPGGWIRGFFAVCAWLAMASPSSWAQVYQWTNFAGMPGGAGNGDGSGSTARFNSPYGVAVDGSGNTYVADTNNSTIRKVTPDGVVTTLAGLAGLAGSTGSTDGTGSAARFWNPCGVAVDGSGNVYVTDRGSSTIRKVTPGGVVSTIGGTADVVNGLDGTGTAASFSEPPGIAVSSSGTLFVADTVNNRISMGIVLSAPAPETAPASLITSTAANLNGTVNANGLSTTVSFEYGLTTAYGTTLSATPATVTGNSASPVSLLINGLSPSATYHFRVKATSDQGTTLGGDMTFTTAAAPVATTQPASYITSASASLYGTLSNSSGFDSTASFDIGLTTAYGTNITGWLLKIVGSSDAFANALIGGLSPGSTYHFRVKSTGTQGTILGDDMTFTTLPLPPTANTNRVALSVSGNSATVHGTVNANGFSTTVSFDYGLTTDYGSSMAATPSPVTDSTDTDVSTVLTGLAPEATYHYRVSATSSQGTTTGADQTFTTLPRVFTPTSWRQQWYGINTNTGTAADSADPFHTGVPNLVAFALIGPSQNPATATLAQLPQPQMVGPYLVYFFLEPTGVSNIIYGAQYSNSLNPADWQPVSDTGSGSVHAFVVPTDGKTHLFMRLTLTNLAP